MAIRESECRRATARPWRWWYGYGVHSKLHEYDPTRDWEVIGKALSAKHWFPLGFFLPKDYYRKDTSNPWEQVDGVKVQSLVDRKGKFMTRWVWTPHQQREARVMWGKIDRAARRLHQHGELWTYLHTKSGVLRVKTFGERPNHKMPDRRPIGRHYNYGNTTYVYCPSHDSVEERANDKRIVGKFTWEDNRDAALAHRTPSGGCESPMFPLDALVPKNSVNEERAVRWDDLPDHLLRREIVQRIILRRREDDKTRDAQQRVQISERGALSTWTDGGKWREYIKPFKCAFKPTDIKRHEAQMERGFCMWPRKW